MTPRILLQSAGALASLVLLAPTLDTASATPALQAVGGVASPVEQVRLLHHRRRHHVVRAEPRYEGDPAGSARPGYGYGPSPSYGGFANTQNGAPPDNEFDPTRPYGGQAAITAPPGTAAYEEQANERRYFCEYAPERC